MITVALGDVLQEIRTGPFGSLLHKSDYVFDGIPLVNPMHISDGRVKPDPSYTITAAKAASLSGYMLKAGDIVMGRRGEMGRCAVVREEDGPLLCGTGSMILSPDPTRLNAHYAAHMLQTPKARQFYENEASGVTMLNLNPSAAAKLLLPLPPLEEQKRIAAILDQADELRRKRQRALDRLNQLGQAIFMEMFGDSPQEVQQPLASVCDLITDGTHYTPTYAETGVVFLSAKNVTKRRIDWENVKYIPETLHMELQRRVSPRVNDVLLAKNGTTGVAALVDRECVFDIYVSLALLRPSNRILPKFLLEAINCDTTRRQFDGSLKGIGVSNLHLVDIRSAVIPVPSISAQAEFVTRIEDVERLRDGAVNSLARCESLFASLQHRAFCGELTASCLKVAAA